MVKMRFNPNKDLGKYSQGRKNPIKVIRVPYKADLGFKPLIKHLLKKNRKKKTAGKTVQHFVSASKLFKTYNTLPNNSPAQTVPSNPSTEHIPIKPVIIPPLVISQYPTYHLKAIPYTPMPSYKSSILKAGECLTPSTSEHREDNVAPLSLLLLPDDVKETL